MKKIFQSLILSLGLCLNLALMSPVPALAQCSSSDVKSALECGASGGNPNQSSDDPAKTLSDTVSTGLNILSIVVGIAAVIMIIVGGFRLITGSGNPESLKAGRSTLIYAAIGLVVVALAQIIVHFVLEKTNKATGANGGTSLIYKIDRGA